MNFEKSRGLQITAVALLSLIYVGLVLGNGLDRLTATHPELASAVPPLFASEALRIAGARALRVGDVPSTIMIGKKALRDAPTDPQSAAMLGAGLLSIGDKASADRAFRVAGQLGWRVPITQSYWLGKALRISDYQSAALRFDALVRQQPALLAQSQLLDPMERNPAGRAALIQRMALNPEWLRTYIEFGAEAPVDAMLQRTVVLKEATKAGVVLGCAAVAPIVRRLVGMKMTDEAAQLWRAHCPAKDRAVIIDPPI